METIGATVQKLPPRRTEALKLRLPVHDYRSLPIPGFEKAKLGIAYVKVTDIPSSLDNFMEINPRVPNRTKKGILQGPVAKGILTTLRDMPEEMVLKNQGIYLLVDDINFNNGSLSISFTDTGKHGIINGGHTYAAIREAIETADEQALKTLENAYVRLHIFQGIDEDFVSEIAEGLNRSKQVDDPSLANLQGEFDIIRKVMKNYPGENAIAYHQGDEGDIYISEVLVFLSIFNPDRFSDKKQPNNLYYKQALGLKYFAEDMENSKKNLMMLIEKLPEFLWLGDMIRKLTPDAAKRNNFTFGRAKIGASRAGSQKHKGTFLPFINETVDYRVPNGWVYPMLASFRANLKKSDDGRRYEWRAPLQKILNDIIDDLVGICIAEHKENNMKPELIGKRESAYNQCYSKVELYLAKKKLLD